MPSPKAPQPQDMRAPAERSRDVAFAQAEQARLGSEETARGERVEAERSRIAGFDERLALPDYGYEASGRGQQIRSPFERQSALIPEQSANTYAAAGFGPKRVGPQAATTGREQRKLSEASAVQESADIAGYRRFQESYGADALPLISGLAGPHVGGPAIATPGQQGTSGVGGALGGLIGTFADPILSAAGKKVAGPGVLGLST